MLELEDQERVFQDVRQDLGDLVQKKCLPRFGVEILGLRVYGVGFTELRVRLNFEIFQEKSAG